MAKPYELLLLLFFLTICRAAVFYPISDRHRTAAQDFFGSVAGKSRSLEETYEAIRTLHVLGIQEKTNEKHESCSLIAEALRSPNSSIGNLFYALKVASIIGCQVDKEVGGEIIHHLEATLRNANSLLDFYHSVGSLALIQDLGIGSIKPLVDATDVFNTIKSLGQDSGRWKHNINDEDSSVCAAGVAIETLASLLRLGSTTVDQSLVGMVKADIKKLFNTIESYDDGTLYFSEEAANGNKNPGPLFTTAVVVRGITAFFRVTSDRLNVPGDKILGLANFLLSIGVPGNSKDLFSQIDALACLGESRESVPLIFSLPSTVLSLNAKDLLKVKVTTVLGSNAPPLTVKLTKAFRYGSESSPVIQNEEMQFDSESGIHTLDMLSKGVDVGEYKLFFEASLHDPEQRNIYITGGRIDVHVHVTGFIELKHGKISILDSDSGIVESLKRFDLSSKDSLSLSANHLQKLSLSFHLATPLGQPFNPHQVLLQLRHEDSQLQHTFVVSNAQKQFEIILDFLGLVEKFFYLSGRYTLQLTVGDAVMENSFLKALGHLDLDLPDRPEKALRPPLVSADPYSRFKPKAEISHIFREPEKQPPEQLSMAFLVVTLFPAAVFLIGLRKLGVNLKNFPSATVPAIFALLFHIGIAAILLLYVLFWLKLNLFTTLKVLGLLGAVVVFFGHRTLSYLALTSSKLKSA